MLPKFKVSANIVQWTPDLANPRFNENLSILRGKAQCPGSPKSFSQLPMQQNPDLTGFVLVPLLNQEFIVRHLILFTNMNASNL